MPYTLRWGRLEKIRGAIFDIHGEPLAEGDRVTFLDVHKTCHACWHCLVAKASTRCPHRKVYGITYGVDRDGLTGGWSEKIEIKPGTLCLRLDLDLQPDSALLAVELSEVCGTDVYLREGQLDELFLAHQTLPSAVKKDEEPSAG